MYRVSVTIDVTPTDSPMTTYGAPPVDVAGDPLPPGMFGADGPRPVGKIGDGKILELVTQLLPLLLALLRK